MFPIRAPGLFLLPAALFVGIVIIRAPAMRTRPCVWYAERATCTYTTNGWGAEMIEIRNDRDQLINVQPEEHIFTLVYNGTLRFLLY